MTSRRFPPSIAAAGTMAAILLLSACATATIEDAVPVSATALPSADETATSATATPEASATAASLSRPGDYPNLNVVPQPAMTQITEDKRDADTTMLRSIREQQQAAARARRSTGSAAELRRLARSHAKDALKEIEGQ